MNLMAKLKAMQREIDALRAQIDERLQAMQRPQDPRPSAVPMESDDAEPLTTEQFRAILDSMPLAKPIVDAKPIASATMAPPQKKRGRPPKAT